MCVLTKKNLLQGEVCKVHKDVAFEKENEIKEVTGGVNYFPHDHIKKVYIYVTGGNMIVLSVDGDYFVVHLKTGYIVDNSPHVMVIKPDHS